MNQFTPPPLLDRNPVTQAKHRREVFRQITLPMLLGALLFVGISTLTAWGSVAGEHGRWAGISLIWLIIPTLITAFILLVVLVGLVYLFTMAIVKLPPFARKVQDFFSLIHFKVAQFNDRLVEPILKAHSYKASSQALGKQLRRK